MKNYSLFFLRGLMFCSMLPMCVLAENDKLLHFGGSAALSFIGAATLCSLDITTSSPSFEIGGFVFSLTVGVAKEATDETFDSADMVANLAGASVGSLGSHVLLPKCHGKTREGNKKTLRRQQERITLDMSDVKNVYDDMWGHENVANMTSVRSSG